MVITSDSLWILWNSINFWFIWSGINKKTILSCQKLDTLHGIYLFCNFIRMIPWYHCPSICTSTKAHWWSSLYLAFSRYFLQQYIKENLFRCRLRMFHDYVYWTLIWAYFLCCISSTTEEICIKIITLTEQNFLFKHSTK